MEINGCAVVNAQQATADFGENPSWLATVNQVNLSLGKSPNFSHFLVSCHDVSQFFPEQDDFEIKIGRQCGGNFQYVEFKGYVTIATQQAFNTDGSPWLVTVADLRAKIENSNVTKNWNVDPESGKSYDNVIDDIASTTSLGDFIDRNFPTQPLGQPCNLKYEGWNVMAALDDLAKRTSHVVGYDPFEKRVKFYDFSGEQFDYIQMMDEPLHRDYKPAATPQAYEIQDAIISYDYKSGAPAGSTADVGAYENVGRGWATCLADCNGVGEALNNEINMLKDSWAAWSERAVNREAKEYLGLYQVACGEMVSSCVWRANGPELFTELILDAPEKPFTYRQKTNDLLIKFKLSSEIDGCGESQGELIDCGCSPDHVVVLKDPTGQAKLYKDVEAGWMGYCRPSNDGSHYDIVSLGKGCCGGDEEEEPPCPPDTIVWYETDVRCVTTTGTTAPGELHQYKRQNEYYFDGWCPSVSQGAWFYDKRIACGIDCCDAEPPEPCEHCDCCVRFGFGYYEPQVWKRTTINQGGWTEYRNCDEPCFLYMTDAEFCDNINLNANEDFACPEGKIAYWHIQLWCQEGGDDETPDTWKVCASRYCSDSQPAMTEPPTGELWDTETGVCCRELQMKCNESSVSAPWTCVQYNEENISFECDNPITIEVVDCPETCGTGTLPTECDVFDPECTYTPPDPEECVHCACCVEINIGNVQTHLVKTQTLNTPFVVYKRCSDPCFLYFTDGGLLPPECDEIPSEFDCSPGDTAVWRVTVECNASGVQSVPDQWRVTAERMCYNGSFPTNDTVVAAPILISGTTTVEMFCDETDQVHGSITTTPTSSINPYSCDIPFWIRKAPDSSCENCGTAACLDIASDCGGDPPPDPGGGGGGDPGGP